MEISAKKMRALLRLAYHAGWSASGEGWNAEFPTSLSASQAKYASDKRAKALSEIVRKLEDEQDVPE